MEKTQVFDVEVSSGYQDNVNDLLMINEDYYLSDEEIIEYYTASAFVWMYDAYAQQVGLHVTEDETDDRVIEDVTVFLDESPVGKIRKDQKKDLLPLIKKGRITRAEAVIGGGPYKQVKNGKVVSGQIRSYVKIKVFYDTKKKAEEPQTVFLSQMELNGGLG